MVMETAITDVGLLTSYAKRKNCSIRTKPTYTPPRSLGDHKLIEDLPVGESSAAERETSASGSATVAWCTA